MRSLQLILTVTLISFATYSCTAQSQSKLKGLKLPSSLPSIPSGNSGTSLTDNEIISGLKEALSQGANKASEQLNKTDGFNLDPKVRIPFPEDCKKVSDKLRDMGMGKKVDEFEVQLNRAAEQAAKEAAPIFMTAVKEMSFADAKSILTGPDTAATGYLRKTTYGSLFNAFNPHIKTALENTLATKLWADLTGIYNKLPTTRTKVNSDLVSYTNHKALKGLFTLVADEELKIRKDPMARTTEILKKVFGSNQN